MSEQVDISTLPAVAIYFSARQQREESTFTVNRTTQPNCRRTQYCGTARGVGMGRGNDKRQQILNQLLIRMRGDDACYEFTILAARNQPTYLSQRSSGLDDSIVKWLPNLSIARTAQVSYELTRANCACPPMSRYLPSSGSSPLHSRLSLLIVRAINFGIFVVTACDSADVGESRHH